MPLLIEDALLRPASYLPAEHRKNSIFIHHTAGGYHPLNTIYGWDNDARGRVATAFVIGGTSSNNKNKVFNGRVFRAFDEKKWAYHLGFDEAGTLDKPSIAIEICNFGYLRKNGKKYITYVNSVVSDEQVITLDVPFRSYRHYHSYSEEQIDSLRQLLVYLATRYEIDLSKGLKEWIQKEKLAMPEGLTTFDKQQWLSLNGFVGLDGTQIAADGIEGPNTRYALSCIGKNAFEINQACIRGGAGLWTHSNVRPDKTDCYPHPLLKSMILSL